PCTQLHTALPLLRRSSLYPFFFLLLPPPPRSTLFPYTTLFRSLRYAQDSTHRAFDDIVRGGSRRAFGMPSFADDLTADQVRLIQDRKSTRLNSSHRTISYAVFCLKKKKISSTIHTTMQTYTRTN